MRRFAVFPNLRRDQQHLVAVRRCSAGWRPAAWQHRQPGRLERAHWPFKGAAVAKQLHWAHQHWADILAWLAQVSGLRGSNDRQQRPQVTVAAQHRQRQLRAHQLSRRRRRQLEVEGQQVAPLAGAGLLHNVLAACPRHHCVTKGAQRGQGPCSCGRCWPHQAAAGRQHIAGHADCVWQHACAHFVGGSTLLHMRRVRESTCRQKERQHKSRQSCSSRRKAAKQRCTTPRRIGCR